MQRSSRAPVLSATFRRDSCWIIGPLLRGLHDLLEAPALELRERTRLDEADDVADLRLVRLVVRVELRAPLDDLLVHRVHLHDVHANDDRLVRTCRDDRALSLLPAAALVLRLRKARDRLSLGRALAGRLRALPAERARQALPLPLRGIGSANGGGLVRVGRSRGRPFSWLLRWLGLRCRLLGRLGLSRGLFGRLGLRLAGLLGRRAFDGLLARRGLSGCLGLLLRAAGHVAFRRPLDGQILGVGHAFGRVGGLRLLRFFLCHLLLAIRRFGVSRSACVLVGHLVSPRARSFLTVRMRAISRLAVRSRALFSSTPVAVWKCRLKSSWRVSAILRSSSSSVMLRRSLALIDGSPWTVQRTSALGAEPGFARREPRCGLARRIRKGGGPRGNHVVHPRESKRSASLFTNLVLTGSFWPARRSASFASSSSTPASSNMTRPGFTTATQPSGEPLPEPIRVSAGFFVNGLSGKTLIQTLPPRLILRVIAMRAASICRFVSHPGSSALMPKSPNCTAVWPLAVPRMRPRWYLRNLVFFGSSIAYAFFRFGCPL